MSETSPKTAPNPAFVPPTMGDSVNQVLDEFKRISLSHCGLAIVEAMAMFTRAGTTNYRWHNDGLHVVVAEIGSVIGGPNPPVATRRATDREYDELEQALAAGCAQIGMFHRMTRRHSILHQATARPIPMDLPEHAQLAVALERRQAPRA